MKSLSSRFTIYNLVILTTGLVFAGANSFLFFLIFAHRTKDERLLSLGTFCAYVVLSALLAIAIFEYKNQKTKLFQLIVDDKRVREKLIRVQKNKIEISSAVSTELRSALQVIRGYASMLVDGSLGTLGLGARAVADKIFAQSKKMSTLADHLVSIPLAAPESNKFAEAKSNVSRRYKRSLYLLKLRTYLFYFIGSFAFLALLLQVFLAPSFTALIMEVWIIIVAIFAGLFVANEMKFEAKSLDTVIELTDDMAATSSEHDALLDEKGQIFRQIKTDIQAPLIAIMSDSRDLSADTTDGISLEAREIAKKVFELSESLTVVVDDLLVGCAAIVE